MNFTAKMSRSDSSAIRVSVHTAGCKCVSGANNARTGYQWGLESTTLADAIAEVKSAEDADARGIKVKAAKCAK